MKRTIWIIICSADTLGASLVIGWVTFRIFDLVRILPPAQAAGMRALTAFVSTIFVALIVWYGTEMAGQNFSNHQ